MTSSAAAPDLDGMDALLRTEGVEALLAGVDELLGEGAGAAAREAVGAALRLAGPALTEDPDQLPAQLLARLRDAGDPAVHDLLEQARRWGRGPWLHPLVASLTSGGGPLVAGLRGHDDDITAVAISADGRWAVSGSVPRTVKVWDLRRGVEQRTLRGRGRYGPGEGYGEGVSAVAVDAATDRVAGADADGRVHLWDLSDGSVIGRAGGRAGDDESWDSTIAADCRRAASAFQYSILTVVERAKRGTVLIHDLGPDDDTTSTIEEGDRNKDALALTPDSRFLFASDRRLLRWDLDAPRSERAHEYDGPPAFRGALAVTADATVAVAGRADGTLTVCDLGRAATTFSLSGHAGPVNAVAVTADGRLAVSGSDDATVRVWDLDRRVETRSLAGHVGDVLAVAVTPDGRWAVSGGADRVLRLWDLQVAPSADPPRRVPVEAVTLSADGRRAMATSADGTREVWNLDDDPTADPSPDPELPEPVPAAVRARVESLERDAAPGAGVHELQAVAVTPDRTLAIAAARAWHVVSGRHRWATDTHTVRVWDLADAEPTGRVLAERSDSVVGFQQGESFGDVAVSADGRYAAAAGDDRTLTVWDLEAGSPVGAFTADGPLRVCALSADGGTVAAGGITGDVHLLRVTTGEA